MCVHSLFWFFFFSPPLLKSREFGARYEKIKNKISGREFFLSAARAPPNGSPTGNVVKKILGFSVCVCVALTFCGGNVDGGRCLDFEQGVGDIHYDPSPPTAPGREAPEGAPSIQATAEGERVDKMSLQQQIYVSASRFFFFFKKKERRRRKKEEQGKYPL